MAGACVPVLMRCLIAVVMCRVMEMRAKCVVRQIYGARISVHSFAPTVRYKKRVLRWWVRISGPKQESQSVGLAS